MKWLNNPQSMSNSSNFKNIKRTYDMEATIGSSSSLYNGVDSKKISGKGEVDEGYNHDTEYDDLDDDEGAGDNIEGCGDDDDDDGEMDPSICKPGNEHTGRWTRKEHDLFVEALKKYGKVSTSIILLTTITIFNIQLIYDSVYVYATLGMEKSR